MTINFYSLLHLAPAEKTAVNMAVRDFSDQVATYLRCALMLSETLAQFGQTFTLLTNDRSRIETRLAAMSRALAVREIEFPTRLPSGLKFYSSYFKIDCYRHFARLPDASCLLDLDMICIGPMPGGLEHAADSGAGVTYDISDQLVPPEWERDAISEALSTLSGLRSEGRWFGGEFICGPPEFFREMVAAIDAILPRYLSHLSDADGPINRSGEEPIVSAAIEVAKANGRKIADAGQMGVVARYWSETPNHPQPPLADLLSSFLLHLPNDKRILAEMAARPPVGPEQFLSRYQALARREQIRNSLPFRLLRLPAKISRRVFRRQSPK